ncbi:GNAT family N-acetyltransferase [Carbonactinospora thermoautotrophica]|uniref:GNAT family N-acetyltransferase n=1 Tax=Carbonactinospora thermoautotrophica TaxID=1469144 RepID=UPI00226F5577|nr:N-acetyltransferase [Carbonactinospora thermoautotrophica]MCX9193213.1 GNAT family N-acetyltransferase [Carbonactinospora thermoautotrophica]
MEHFRIRLERGGDQAAIRAVHTAAFGREAESALVDALRASDAWLPGLSLVAEAAGEIIGHVLLTRATVGGEPLLALAPLAVRPDRRRQGVGGALVRTALDKAEAAGERIVVVLGDPRYYGRFGFEPASRHGLRSPWEVPDEVYQARPLAGYAGHQRGMVTYPVAFAAVS